MNDQNLIPNSERSPSEVRENGRKGGIKSGEARRDKKNLRMALEILLEKDFTDMQGQTRSGSEAISAKLFSEALKGNVKAFEVIRDTVGQKPVEKVEQQNTNIVVDLSDIENDND